MYDNMVVIEPWDCNLEHFDIIHEEVDIDIQKWFADKATIKNYHLYWQQARVMIKEGEPSVRIIDMRLVVYFANEEDAILFKLGWDNG